MKRAIAGVAVMEYTKVCDGTQFCSFRFFKGVSLSFVGTQCRNLRGLLFDGSSEV